MNSSLKNDHARPASGFVLLEVILALALFVLVAVGMTQALGQMARTSTTARQEAQVLRQLESVLAEVRHQPELKKGSFDFPVNEQGIAATATVQEVELYTKDKVKLDHMFLVRAEAWIRDGRDQLLRRAMESYVYSPNSPTS